MTTRNRKSHAWARTAIVAALAILTGLVAVIGLPLHTADAQSAGAKPTVVFVHGAFAESASWSRVAAQLLAKGYPVTAVANPLRGVENDAAYVSAALRSIGGPVILVGHSYGGNVITNAATDNVKALVYVSGFAPEVGESASKLSSKFPGSTLAAALSPPVVLPDGSKDMYIRKDKFHAQFAADLPAGEARVMASTQRPIAQAALDEPASSAAWKTIPSWFLYGSADKNIPPAVHAFMAQRAAAKRAVEVGGASHVVMISHPEALVKLVEEAAANTSK